MRIVVVGGGMAGARLAQQLAPYGGLDVTVLGEEPHTAYNRVLLAEVLAGRYGPDVVALPGAAGAGVRRGVRVVRIDREDRAVVCDDGSVVGYDRLVLATGSNPVLPPLRGLFVGAPPGPLGLGGAGQGQLPSGVHSFRTMDDCLALSAAVAPGTRVVVVGGGLLGVSAARALAARGAQVVIAQQGEHLMERHLDEEAAGLLRSHLQAQGIEVHTECRVRGLHTGPEADRPVRSVELADHYRLEADLVVLACGIRPRVGLAHAAGLTVAKGIVVDDELRTSDPYIHAVGDCAQHDGVVYGLAGPARDQADTLARILGAGEAAAGGRTYAGTRALTRLTLGGSEVLDIAAFGETAPAPGDDVLRLTDATRGAYRKVVMRGDRLVGGILLGDLATVGAVARTWEGDEPLPSSPLHLLTNDGGS